MFGRVFRGSLAEIIWRTADGGVADGGVGFSLYGIPNCGLHFVALQRGRLLGSTAAHVRSARATAARVRSARATGL